MKKEDVKLMVQDDVMSISVERKYEKEEKGKRCHRRMGVRKLFAKLHIAGRYRRQQGHAEYKYGVLKVPPTQIGEGETEIDRGEGLLRTTEEAAEKLL